MTKSIGSRRHFMACGLSTLSVLFLGCGSGGSNESARHGEEGRFGGMLIEFDGGFVELVRNDLAGRLELHVWTPDLEDRPIQAMALRLAIDGESETFEFSGASDETSNSKFFRKDDELRKRLYPPPKLKLIESASEKLSVSRD